MITVQAIRPSIERRARPPRPGWEGWEGIVRAGLLVLACALSSAGHAQLQARDLDHAVGELVRTLVNEGRLSGHRVYVGSDDFFEEENELRPPLSKILRTMSLRALTDRQVEVALVQAEAARVLHGRWRRESGTHLHLTLFIADPARDREEPVATRSADALVPLEGLRRRDIEPTLRHWGTAWCGVWRGTCRGAGDSACICRRSRSRTRRCPRSLARTFWAVGARRSPAATGSRSSAPPNRPRVCFTATFSCPAGTSRWA